MKKLVFLSLALALVLPLLVPGAAVQGQSSSAPTWTSIISFYNPSSISDETGLTVVYYKNEAGGVSEIPSNPIPVHDHGSGTLMVGSILKDPEFTGSAVVSATVPLLATYKQVVPSAEPYSPILYNSFSMADAGPTVYLPSILRTAAYDTQIGIQNLLGNEVNLDIKFYDQSGTETPCGVDGTIAPQSSYIFNASKCISDTSFNGSMIATATIDGTSDPGKIVAVAKDVQAGGRRAYAYEGVSGGTDTVFMPTAMCQTGETEITTYFDVQNVGDDTTEVWVDYYDSNGQMVYEDSYLLTTSIPKGAKAILDPCDENLIEYTGGKSMTAVINSTGQNIAAVGKAVSNDGLMTAFTGQTALNPDFTFVDPRYPEEDAKYHIALPNVEFSTQANGYKTYITVMNIDGSETTANDIKVLYYGQDGSLIGTHYLATDRNDMSRLPAYGKRSTDPTYARAVSSGTRGFYGAVEILSDVPIVVLARVQRSVDVGSYGTLGEDYTGLYFDEP